MPIREGAASLGVGNVVAVNGISGDIVRPDCEAIKKDWDALPEEEKEAPKAFEAFPAWMDEAVARMKERKEKEKEEERARLEKEKMEKEEEKAYSARIDSFLEIVFARPLHSGILDAFYAFEEKVAVEAGKMQAGKDKYARERVLAWIDDALAKPPAFFGDVEEVAEVVA